MEENGQGLYVSIVVILHHLSGLRAWGQHSASAGCREEKCEVDWRMHGVGEWCELSWKLASEEEGWARLSRGVADEHGVCGI